MIQMRTWMIENSRSPTKSSQWRATVFVNGDLSAPNGELRGELFTETSRNGAPNELARTLVAHGFPDQPVEIVDDDFGMIVFRYRSLHAMAKWTYEGGGRRKWRDRPFQFGGGQAKNATEDNAA
jgi:hypothetical protein